MLTFLIFAPKSFACSVCYGAASNSSMAALALKISVISLLVILLCVLGNFAWFFIQMTRRSKNVFITK